MVVFGTQRDRYQSAYQMQCYSGIAPVTGASGNSQWVHFRFACPTFLRLTFHEFAGCSIPQSEWARAYYDHQHHDKNKSHQVAVRSLAFQWVRIIYRCWKDGKAYDEAIYMQSLRRRGSLLAGVPGTPPASGGSRWPASNDSPKIILDGLAQKTPLHQRSCPVSAVAPAANAGKAAHC